MGTLRQIIKTLTHPFLKRGLTYYYRKPRSYTYSGITVMVHPDVFPPQLTLSTKILLNYISKIDLNYKTFLELGCGSGIISLFASHKGAFVTASDINKTALRYLKNASSQNSLKVTCTYSNLFDAFENKQFNYIFINPPYYPKTPENVKQAAWFCGNNFDYFYALFEQLPQYLNADNKTFMILSEDCKIDHIKTIASKNGITLELILKEKKIGELNYIFKIQKNTPTI